MARGGKRPGAGRKPGGAKSEGAQDPALFVPQMGRPSKYDPAYCAEVIQFCAQGFSLTAYAGAIGVSRDTLTEWGKVHDDFSVALRAAKAASAFWWEQRARKVGQQGGGPGTATMIVFQLKNMAGDDFREKVDNTHSAPDGGPVRIERIERVIVDPANPNP